MGGGESREFLPEVDLFPGAAQCGWEFYRQRFQFQLHTQTGGHPLGTNMQVTTTTTTTTVLLITTTGSFLSPPQTPSKYFTHSGSLLNPHNSSMAHSPILRPHQNHLATTLKCRSVSTGPRWSEVVSDSS